jgi:hypothetical protein
MRRAEQVADTTLTLTAQMELLTEATVVLAVAQHQAHQPKVAMVARAL